MRRRLQDAAAAVLILAVVLGFAGALVAKGRGVIVPPKCIQRIQFLHLCEPISRTQCDVKARVTFACVEYPKPEEKKP